MPLDTSGEPLSIGDRVRVTLGSGPDLAGYQTLAERAIAAHEEDGDLRDLGPEELVDFIYPAYDLALPSIFGSRPTELPGI
jgi:hypothetical protein